MVQVGDGLYQMREGYLSMIFPSVSARVNNPSIPNHPISLQPQKINPTSRIPNLKVDAEPPGPTPPLIQPSNPPPLHIVEIKPHRRIRSSS